MLNAAPETKNVCPDCGTAIPAASPGNLCPRCLGLSAIGTLVPTIGVDSIAKRRFFGDYELFGELGRGGSGIVFKARQFGVNRTVALKLLLSGTAAGRDFIHRFHTEAAAAAHLEHPNIVPIYEFGEHEGAHFLVMRCFEGGTLQARIARDRLSPEQSARLLITIASAVEHAHRHGILHRDLKPSNILLDSAGSPYISDFGLARVTERDSSLTLSHTVLGTISYVAPEVAVSGAAASTTASDIYGLGAILYELLTGRPPFTAETMAATLRKISEQDPVLPRIHNSGVPLDLETICLRCLEKDPAKRYATAQQLAEDLQRFLNNEPIFARPITRTAKLVRWSQRNRALTTAYSLLLLVLLVVVVGSPLAIYRISEARKAEAFERSLAQSAARQESSLRQASDSQAYAADMNLAYHEWEQGNLGRAQALLRSHIPLAGGRDLRGFEWRYLWQLCRDERLGTVPLNEDSISSLATSAEHSFVAAACNQAVRLFEPSTGRHLASLPYPNASSPNPFPCLALAPHATNLIAGHRAAGLITFWDAATQARLFSFDAFTNNVGVLALSPDGTFVAAADRQHLYSTTLSLWAVSLRSLGARPVWSVPVEDVIALSFTPDGKRLVVAKSSDFRCTIELVDLATGAVLSSLPDAAAGYISTISFSPDGRLMATAGAEGRIRVWDFEHLTFKGYCEGHSGIVRSLAFSPDGRFLLSAGHDHTIRRWDPSALRSRGLWSEKIGLGLAVYAPDGKSILSATEKAINLWRPEPPSPAERLPQASGRGWLSVSPNSRWLVRSTMGSEPDAATLIDLRNEKPPKLLRYKATFSHSLAFSPDGRFLAVGDLERDGLVGIWNTQLWDSSDDIQEPFAYLTNHFEAGSLAFSPDSQILAVAGLSFQPHAPRNPSHATNRLAFWRVGSWQNVDLLPNAGAAANESHAAATVRFSPDGRLIALGFRDHRVRLFELAAGRLLHLWNELDNGGWAADIRFSPDGRWLACYSLGGRSALLIDLSDLQHPSVVALIRDPISEIFWAEFAPDSKTLAFAHADGLIHFWSLQSLSVALTVRHSYGPYGALSFAPDGTFLTSKDANMAKLWRAAPLPETPQIQQYYEKSYQK